MWINWCLNYPRSPRESRTKSHCEYLSRFHPDFKSCFFYIHAFTICEAACLDLSHSLPLPISLSHHLPVYPSLPLHLSLDFEKKYTKVRTNLVGILYTGTYRYRIGTNDERQYMLFIGSICCIYIYKYLFFIFLIYIALLYFPKQIIWEILYKWLSAVDNIWNTIH